MIGKWILIFGAVLIVVGATIWLIESLGLPLGRLPGDIRMRGESWSFHLSFDSYKRSPAQLIRMPQIGGDAGFPMGLLLQEPGPDIGSRPESGWDSFALSGGS
jgi:hypothetical protein